MSDEENDMTQFRANPIPDPEKVFSTIFMGIKGAFALSDYGFASDDPETVPTDDDTDVVEVRMMTVATLDKRVYRVWVEDMGHDPDLQWEDEED